MFHRALLQSTRAFHHRTPSSLAVKKNPRSLELLKFKKSEMVVTNIQTLVYYSILLQTKASQYKSFRDQWGTCFDDTKLITCSLTWPCALELLKFKKSEMVVTDIQTLINYSTFLPRKASQSKSFRDQCGTCFDNTN